ncbi:LON peptidase substrate-binding domain-containing protein [Pendulispora brunnea]|uniref:LON peptidase substrate-binding domain-containing protein n=1 Tax=Pendulispora brunnea TaxID=2905690 RepID=A0ABZ2K1Q6_9BACT
MSSPRELPSEPHIDHLKKQAKDLLEGHKRGDLEAIARLKTALPSLASCSDAEAAQAPLALHDAQSAIAREYGFKSWKELSDEVERRRSLGLSPELVQSLVSGPFQAHAGVPLPSSVSDALREAWTKGDVADVLAAKMPEELPLLAARNALVVPGAVVPLHIGRPASVAAIVTAQRLTPPTIAVFAQRDAATEDVRAESLHPVGCQALVVRVDANADGRTFVVLRGLRWVSLTSLDPAGDDATYATARVARVEVQDDGKPGEVAALARDLRERARNLARTMTGGDRAVAILDAIENPEHLSNLVMANLPAPVCPLDDLARYAAERSLPGKLRIALALTGG